MEKFGILSRHIVLSSQTYPIYGIILIQNELIKDIIVLENTLTTAEAILKFPHWNILNYSDYYISAGLIDLNTRKEWESYKTFTKSAISGGTTFILEEPSFYGNTNETEELFCDIGRCAIIHDLNLSENIENILALKAYLFQPASGVQVLTDPINLIELGNRKHLPLFIDPTLPDPRMHYMASPLRHESTEDHKDKEVVHSRVFAAAFSYCNNTEESLSTLPLEQRTTNSLNECEIESFRSKLEYTSEEIKTAPRFSAADPVKTTSEEEEFKQEENKKQRNQRKGSYTIYDDLDHRIKEDQKSIENLCLAEKSTYGNSGNTSFINTDKKSTASRRRPTALVINSTNKPEVVLDYTFYLASCSEIWETQGIDLVLGKLTQDTQVHFQNISSAGAINKIRKAAKLNKKLTCELPATHLYFNSANVDKNDTRIKSCPPIRSASNFNLLWDLLKMRGINCISSQHALIEESLKAIDTHSFQHALNGIPSLGNTLLAVWSTINIPMSRAEHLEHYLVRLSKWFSLHPAKVLELKKRGSIAKGKYADLIVWDPYCKSIAVVCEEYGKISPFVGKEMFGKIEKVFLRGNLAYDSGVFLQFGKRTKSKDSD